MSHPEIYWTEGRAVGSIEIGEKDREIERDLAIDVPVKLSLDVGSPDQGHHFCY